MKIAFQGFRGFGKKYDFLEISDLTILTGKNSSGKSTFIKLLKLLCEAFEGVNSLQDLANIKINIATEIIGGKESLKSLQKVSQAKFVFTTKFEFFIDDHEIHLNFEISNYILEIKTIEIFDEASLKINIPLLSIHSDIIKLNAKALFLKYNKFAILYNIFEEYRYRSEEKQWKSKGEEYVNKFDKEREELFLTDKKIKEEILGHISSNVSNSAILEMESFPKHEFNHPFKITDIMQGGWYRLLSIMDGKLGYTRQEIDNLIEQSQHKEEINSFINKVKSFDSSYNFADQFKKWHDFEIENYYVSIKDFVFDGYAETYQAVGWMVKGFFQFNKDGNDNYAFHNIGENIITLECGKDLFDEINDPKFAIQYYLGKGSCIIYQKSIVQFIKSLSNCKFQSNVRNLPERSYNIYHSDSIFSSFIKQYRVLNKADKNKKTLFIKSYLNKFEIADDINIKFENNMGFIQLIKKENLFSIIDEGSGVSNILSCLLFTKVSHI